MYLRYQHYAILMYRFNQILLKTILPTTMDQFVVKRTRDEAEPIPSSRGFREEPPLPAEEYVPRMVDPSSFEQFNSTDLRAEAVCYNCNRKGHYAKDCPHPKVPRYGPRGDGNQVQCLLCKGYGHVANSMCPNKRRSQGHVTRQKCQDLFRLMNSIEDQNLRKSLILMSADVFELEGHFCNHAPNKTTDTVGCLFARYKEKVQKSDTEELLGTF